MDENDIQLDKELADLKIALEGDGKTVVMAAIDKTLVCIIAIADVIKPEAGLAIEALEKFGIVPYMLTGDNKRTAAAVGKWIGKHTFSHVVFFAVPFSSLLSSPLLSLSPLLPTST